MIVARRGGPKGPAPSKDVLSISPGLSLHFDGLGLLIDNTDIALAPSSVGEGDAHCLCSTTSCPWRPPPLPTAQMEWNTKETMRGEIPRTNTSHMCLSPDNASSMPKGISHNRKNSTRVRCRRTQPVHLSTERQATWRSGRRMPHNPLG